MWHQAISRRGINTTVVVDAKGNVYTTHGEENPAGTAMGAVVRIAGHVAAANPTSAEQFRVEELTVGKSSPLLIAQRYTLEMMGESQQLQIRTWAAQLRMARSVPFAWKADTWYTLKFRASLQDGVAVLQGKAWPRGTEEPAAWTVTATDESANVQRSPGLFGNAPSDEILIDNVTVSANP